MTTRNAKGHAISPSRYERVFFDGKSVYLAIERESETFLVGRHVNRFGEEVPPKDGDVLIHVIDKSVITKRVPYQLNMHYVELERVR